MRHLFFLLFIGIIAFGCDKMKGKPKDLYDQSEPASETKAEPGKQTGINVGDLAPEISLPAPDGKIVTLSSLKGKYVLIDFWASWCPPCRRENPNVVRMYDQYKDKSFEIYGVSLDGSKEKWEEAIKADGLPWIHVSDLGGWNSSVVPQFSISGIPHTILLDKEGRIIAKDLRGESLEAKLKEVIG